MTFSEALQKMEAGAFVAREGWNGKNQFIFMVEGVTVPRITLNRRTTSAIRYWDKLNHLDTEEEHSRVDIAPYIAMINVQGELVRGWLASQTDMTADDWYVRDYTQNHQEAGDGTQSNK